MYPKLALRLVRAVVACVVVVVAVPSPAAACECANGSHRRYVRRVRAIFVGTVTRIDEGPVGPIQGARAPQGKGAMCSSTITFAVTRWFKGGKQDTIRVRYCEAGCPAMSFRIAEQYLVYADGEPLGALVGCTRTRRFTDDDYETDDEVRQLSSRWFRFWARVWP